MGQEAERQAHLSAEGGGGGGRMKCKGGEW